MTLQIGGYQGSSRSGWLPLIAAVPGAEDNALTVGNTYLQLQDYYGGQGTKPTENVGMYLAGTGLTAVQQDATNISPFTSAQVSSYLRTNELFVSEHPIEIVDEFPTNPDSNTLYYVRGGTRGSGLVTHVTYAHSGAAELDGAHSVISLYGVGDDRTLPANTNQWRKFVSGSVLSSSNDGAVLPASAGLNWRIGARNNVDPDLGEASGSSLINNTVFSLDGTWRVRCGITLDNLSTSGNNRLRLMMRKANRVNEADDTVFFAHGGAITSISSANHVGAVNEDALLRDRVATVSLELPWGRFASGNMYYMVWRLDNVDGAIGSTAEFRMRHSYLQFEKWGT